MMGRPLSVSRFAQRNRRVIACEKAQKSLRLAKTLAASEQSAPAWAAWHDLAAYRPPDQLIFVDECGSHSALSPLYARSPRGQRARDAVPRNLCSSLSLWSHFCTGPLWACPQPTQQKRLLRRWAVLWSLWW